MMSNEKLQDDYTKDTAPNSEPKRRKIIDPKFKETEKKECEVSSEPSQKSTISHAINSKATPGCKLLVNCAVLSRGEPLLVYMYSEVIGRCVHVPATEEQLQLVVCYQPKMEVTICFTSCSPAWGDDSDLVRSLFGRFIHGIF